MSLDESWTPEEAWEADVRAALGGLPTVEPPAEFLATATDHRPLHAGRTLVGAVAALLIGFAVAVATDLAGPGSVVLDPANITAALGTEGEPDSRTGPAATDAGASASADGAGTAGGQSGDSILDRVNAVVDAVNAQLGFPSPPGP